MKRIMSLILTTLMTLAFFLPPYSIVEAASITTSKNTVMTQRLRETLSSANEIDVFQVVVWIKDIEQNQLNEKAENTVANQAKKLKDASKIEQARAFRTAKLQHAKVAYKENNDDFLNNVLRKAGTVEVIFQSTIAPMFVIKANKQTIEKIANRSLVTYINLQEEAISSEAGNVANVNSGVNSLASTSTLSATGNGIKIGVVEQSIPDINAVCGNTPIFNSENIHIISEESSVGLHATVVSAIIAGQNVTVSGKSYKGIVPDAELYAIAVDKYTFFEKTELLVLDYNVDIINISLSFYYPGYQDEEKYSFYDNYCKWLDYIIDIFGVHVVVASGNIDEEFIGTDCVASPALSYNAISVGAYYDNNLLLSSHAPSTLAGQELNSNYHISSISGFLGYISSPPPSGGNEGRIQIYKPDLVAMGELYRYGTWDMTGTSAAAPQVTGMIAQLCDIYPYLLDKPLLVKAMLMSGASYLVNIAASGDVKDYASGLYLKQGAGMANVRCAYTNYYAGRIKEFSKNFTAGSSYSFTINIPSHYTYIKMAMCWNKKIDETSLYNVTERPHANLRLSVYKGTNTSILPVATSDTMYTNSELLQFAVTQGGTYTVVVTRMDSGASITHDVAISWY